MYQVCKNFIKKTNSINDLIKHNYNYEKRQTTADALRNKDRMEAELRFYQTTENNCSCGQNKLLSSILNIDFPCVHRVFNGEDFPDCPFVEINLSKHETPLIVETFDVEDDETNQYNSNSIGYDIF